MLNDQASICVAWDKIKENVILTIHTCQLIISWKSIELVSNFFFKVPFFIIFGVPYSTQFFFKKKVQVSVLTLAMPPYETMLTSVPLIELSIFCYLELPVSNPLSTEDVHFWRHSPTYPSISLHSTSTKKSRQPSLHELRVADPKSLRGGPKPQAV